MALSNTDDDAIAVCGVGIVQPDPGAGPEGGRNGVVVRFGVVDAPGSDLDPLIDVLRFYDNQPGSEMVPGSSSSHAVHNSPLRYFLHPDEISQFQSVWE